VTSRERVLSALDFIEPDRVPIDLGGSIMSGIMAHALHRLRLHLGLEPHLVKIYEVFQMLGEMELDIVDRLGVDVLPVEPPAQFFGLRRENWKPLSLWDGTRVLVPGGFGVEISPEGDWLLHTGGDPAAPVEARMPKDGFYFDKPAQSESHFDYRPPALAELRRENHLSPQELDFLQARAEHLRRTTDKALFLGCWGKFGLPWVGSFTDFLVLSLTDQAYVKDMFAVRTETALLNMERVKACLGESIDILGLSSTDYGSQNSELFSPEQFEELYVPFFKVQNDWVHRNTHWKTWLHSCGSIARVLPLLVDSGLDILNPIQTSAAGMDPSWLKKKFGGKLVFWGGGVDTQRILPFGSPEEVVADVRDRLRILAPGGGFVFNPVHNIQQGTPPENIVAAFDTVRTNGVYPISLEGN
jgi:hypothetical protein